MPGIKSLGDMISGSGSRVGRAVVVKETPNTRNIVTKVKKAMTFFYLFLIKVSFFAWFLGKSSFEVVIFP